jgi:hypothetical protein
VFIDQLHMETGVLERLVQWARTDAATDEQIRNAIKKLQAHFASLPDPAEAVWADHLLVRDALAERIPPLVFMHPPISFGLHVASVLHNLWWERNRDRLELDILTASNIRSTQRFDRFLREGPKDIEAHRDPADWPYNYYDLRQWLERAISARNAPDLPQQRIPGYGSFLDYEYRARVHLHELHSALADAEMNRRATLIQLALELYRRDHDRYPETLAELAPDYLDTVPFDPYSGRPFLYLPRGTDLPVVDALAAGQRIKPGTPFFWSVGPHNLTTLVRSEGFREDRNPDDPGEIVVFAQMEATYRFWPSDLAWYFGTHLGVFPLPK